MVNNRPNRLTLTNEQISFFKDNGYLILRDVLDREACARARDRVWNSLPEGVHLKRDDPESHFGPFEENEESEDSLYIRKGVNWQVREANTEQESIDLVYNIDLVSVAEQLLGEGMLEPPVPGGEPMGNRGPAWPGGPTDPAIGEGIRGYYWTLPVRDKSRKPLDPHADGHPFCLGMVGLINDVPEDGGSFTVWPGSHRRLFPTFQLRYDTPRIPFYEHMPSHKGLVNSPEFEAEMKAIQDEIEPVACHGKEGDVVLWHHRLAHMAGHNYSDVIRQVVLNDFNRSDLDQLRTKSPKEDMWDDWSAEVQENQSGYSKEFAASQGIVG